MSGGPGVQEPAPDDDLNLLEILNVLLKRWRIVIGLPFAATPVVAGISLLVTPLYTATTSFVPETRSQSRVPAGLAGLAGQFGISVSADASQSPQFYAEVVKSREILDRLLLSHYADPRTAHEEADSATLLTIINAKGRNRADSLERGAKKVAERISVGVDAQTNIVTVRAELPSAELAATVANRLVAYLNEFNTQTRQSQARERRKFTEQRVAAVQQDLRDAEEALRRFYEANRSWQNSPQLLFEESRLRRQLELRQELLLTLRREYETARIEEVNDTPVITVIATANVPQRKSSPERKLWVVLAFVLGGIFGMFWAFGAEYMERARRDQVALYSDLVSNATQARHGLTRAVQSMLPGFAKRNR